MKKFYFFLDSSCDEAPFEDEFVKKILIFLFNYIYKSFNSSV